MKQSAELRLVLGPYCLYLLISLHRLELELVFVFRTREASHRLMHLRLKILQRLRFEFKEL